MRAFLRISGVTKRGLEEANMSASNFYLEEANRCRSGAAECSDPRAQRALEQLAQYYEAEARRASAPPQSRH
jgi:hypothetical protein